MLDVFSKKQMYDSVFMRHENPKKCICIISMFLMSFNNVSIFVWLCMFYV